MENNLRWTKDGAFYDLDGGNATIFPSLTFPDSFAVGFAGDHHCLWIPGTDIDEAMDRVRRIYDGMERHFANKKG